MEQPRESIEKARANFMMRSLNRVQREVRPSQAGMLVRAGLSVLLLGGFVAVYSRFGAVGVVILALLVLLGLSHPLWLLLSRRRQQRFDSTARRNKLYRASTDIPRADHRD